MHRFNTYLTRFIGVLLLSAYSLLLCEEVFHVDRYTVPQTVATVNDGTSHYAHGIILDSHDECAICQSAMSQIHTETFRVDPVPVSYAVGRSVEVSTPALSRLYSFSLRAPPSIS
jgi:hypothetical protein